MECGSMYYKVFTPEDDQCLCYCRSITTTSSTTATTTTTTTMPQCQPPKMYQACHKDCRFCHVVEQECSETCKEGCYCEPGKVEDMHGNCILPRDCECLLPGTNRTMKPFEIINGTETPFEEDNCKKYICLNNKVTESNKTCTACNVSGTYNL
jgi:hypothetical protein